MARIKILLCSWLVMDFTTCRIPVRCRDNKDEFPCEEKLNEFRNKAELKRWWNVPFIDELCYEETGAIGVYVLDSFSWDGPRQISTHESFDEAVNAVNFYITHSQLWRRIDEPYCPLAKVDHLIDHYASLTGCKKPSPNEVFENLFYWLPAAEVTGEEASL